MLNRKITNQLLEWKKAKDKTCLLVKGARQVGKTYIIDQFAKQNYKNYVYINFELMPEKKSIFDGDLDVDSIIRRMSVYFVDVNLEPHKTIIFLDEIQSCPNARVAFKSFSMDKRYDVIGSGSLLGVNYKEVSSYPTGYEKVIELHSLDFEEFLWGVGIKPDILNYLRDCFLQKIEIDGSILNKINEYYRWFILVGGMPRVVETFLETNSFGEVLKLQKDIIGSYLDDITKYAPDSEKTKARKCFASIPNQLARKNKKFRYAEIETGTDIPKKVGARQYEGSLTWLFDAGIVNYCYNLTEPALPLATNIKPDSFKLYVRDTGLLMSMMEDGNQEAILNNDLFINEGSIVENVSAEMFAKSGKKLTYFEKKSTLEIDFVFNLGGVSTAIEIKSGKNLLSKSMDSIIANYKCVGRYIKLESETNIYIDERGIEHYPLFVAMFI